MNRSADALDGYLLRVLCTVVDERSVSRAATRLDQTQPAISAALKRLREILGDPLLVREKMGMVPTARAMQFAAQAKVALAEIGKLVAEPEAFDAQSAQSTFRIATPDYLAAVFLADVARRMRSEAPHCRLEVHPLGPDFDFTHALAQDQLDIVIGNWPHPPEQLHTSLVLEDELVCLVSSAHPFVLDGIGEAEYLAAAHVVPMAYSMTQRGVVETYLAERRLSRDGGGGAVLRAGAVPRRRDRHGLHDGAALRRALRAAAAARHPAGADAVPSHALLSALAPAGASIGGASLAARDGAGSWQVAGECGSARCAVGVLGLGNMGPE